MTVLFQWRVNLKGRTHFWPGNIIILSRCRPLFKIVLGLTSWPHYKTPPLFVTSTQSAQGESSLSSLASISFFLSLNQQGGWKELTTVLVRFIFGLFQVNIEHLTCQYLPLFTQKQALHGLKLAKWPSPKKWQGDIEDGLSLYFLFGFCTFYTHQYK